jgi:two-component system cell cycle sensor histidine kinase/response regulator CckA
MPSRVKPLFEPKNDGERRRRILAVDDEPPILDFVQRVLEPAGYDVTTATSGKQALELATNRGPFDAVVTDLLMPGMNGDELARQLRASFPDLKVLYLTGFSDQLFKDKVTLWHDEAFLDKPTTIKGLTEAVALLLFGSTSKSPAPTDPPA